MILNENQKENTVWSNLENGFLYSILHLNNKILDTSEIFHVTNCRFHVKNISPFSLILRLSNS